ncbi:hypothetical protein B0H12DRAFT_1083285 [Mycena haematopus]|nr:hypothetical protein B0H12DRAFT_1083285 [Mycena haematopus]
MTSSCRPLAKQRLPQARITQEWHNGRSARPKEPPYGRRWILVIAERVMTSRRSGVREEVTVVAVDVVCQRNARAAKHEWEIRRVRGGMSGVARAQDGGGDGGGGLICRFPDCGTMNSRTGWNRGNEAAVPRVLSLYYFTPSR